MKSKSLELISMIVVAVFTGMAFALGSCLNAIVMFQTEMNDAAANAIGILSGAFVFLLGIVFAIIIFSLADIQEKLMETQKEENQEPTS